MKLDERYRPELCVSTDETRYNLMEPYFDAKTEKVIATDGRMLVVCPAEREEGDKSGFISAPGGLDVAHALKRIDSAHADAARGVMRALARTLGPSTIAPAEKGRVFPDWRAVVPDFEEGDPGTVSVALSASFLSAIAKAIAAGAGQIVLTFRAKDGAADSTAPMIVRPVGLSSDDRDEGPRAVGYLMPVRFAMRRPKPAPAREPIPAPPAAAPAGEAPVAAQPVESAPPTAAAEPPPPPVKAEPAP